MIEAFSQNRPPVSIVDALSASGLRSIRFDQELTNVKEIYANDLSIASLTMIEENLKLNGTTKVKRRDFFISSPSHVCKQVDEPRAPFRRD